MPQGKDSSAAVSKTTRDRLLTATRDLLLEVPDARGVTVRAVAARVGITPMAIYKHFRNREHLFEAVVDAEYRTIGRYFQRANARHDAPSLWGMTGYLNYAFDHPELFRYMFATQRLDAAVFPADLASGKSPTFTILVDVVTELTSRGVLKSDDTLEVSLAIWAHAHGLISLYLSGRIGLPRRAFRDLYMRSLSRLWQGLSATRGGTCDEP